MKDQWNRKIDYMRISVTDRCNLHCCFCMPEGKFPYMAPNEILLYDEIEQIVGAAAALGIVNFRITGGEPLIRKEIEVLIEKVKSIQGVKKVAMTTNGVLLKEKLPVLIKAGLDGVNISLCTTDRRMYQQITGYDRLEVVEESIHTALQAGLQVKINCVPMYDYHIGQLETIARYAKEQKIDVRFIEMMPIGQGSFYQGIDSKTIRKCLERTYGKAVPDRQGVLRGNGPAVYYQFPDFKGKIGFISARTCKFCKDCNRVRLTADGKLKLCLNHVDEVDLKQLLRTGATKEELKNIMEQAIYQKPKEHFFEEKELQEKRMKNEEYKRERKKFKGKQYMAQIGG